MIGGIEQKVFYYAALTPFFFLTLTTEKKKKKIPSSSREMYLWIFKISHPYGEKKVIHTLPGKFKSMRHGNTLKQKNENYSKRQYQSRNSVTESLLHELKLINALM